MPARAPMVFVAAGSDGHIPSALFPHARQLQPGVDIHIIACGRGNKGNEGRNIVGVRWASRPDLGFPPSGYHVSLALGSPQQANRTPVGVFWLPRSDTWAHFRVDAVDRTPAIGPYFPPADLIEDNFAYLLPLIRLADPRTPAAEHESLTLSAAEFLGDTHENDAHLAWDLWQHTTPDPIADLVAAPASRSRIIGYYKHQCTVFLLALATRFEYAALLGLGTDHIAQGFDGSFFYIVEAAWEEEGARVRGVSFSDPKRAATPCRPSPPEWVQAERLPGSVGHSAWAVFPPWAFPAEMLPVDNNGRSIPSDSLIPRPPAAFTGLSWAAPRPEPFLIGYEPVLYHVRRYHHGPQSAADTAPPPLPAAAVFESVIPGELAIRGDDAPHFSDLPGMAWPPLEGYYRYEVLGVDLLGTRSSGGPRTAIRHFDDMAPPRPRLRTDGASTLTVPNDVDPLEISLFVDWESGEDFNGPDAIEFRAAASWSATRNQSVRVTDVIDIDDVHADLTVEHLTGTDDEFAGTRVSLPGGDYPIELHDTGSSAIIRIRKLNGRMPDAPADGTIAYADTATPLTRVGKASRHASVAVTVRTVHSTSPLTLEFAAVGTDPVPTDPTLRIYIHLFRGMVTANQNASGHYEVETPPADGPIGANWTTWNALADPAGSLADAPAIIYPAQPMTVTLHPPTGFVAGILSLQVSAADAADYIPSPPLPATDVALTGLTGNESARSELIYSVRNTETVDRPAVIGFNPSHRVWAQSAATYAEQARFELGWTAVGDANRYEVWRVLEGGLTGASPSTSDADLVVLAAAQTDRFEMRSEQVYGTTYEDKLPGRAPTRALYFVKSVNSAGTKSDPSPVIGPVYVPDVRPPPRPNLLRAAATAADVADRAVQLTFTQAGPVNDVRWEVQYRAQDLSSPAGWVAAGTVAIGTTPDSSGRYTFLHEDLPPGKRYQYRVLAVREALDPADASASSFRDIQSPASEIRIASAISSAPLVAPSSLAVAGVTPAADGSGGSDVALSWHNEDVYESVEVLRREDSRHIFRLVAALPGESEGFTDEGVSPGLWYYEIRAVGVNRVAKTASSVEATVP